MIRLIIIFLFLVQLPQVSNSQVYYDNGPIIEDNYNLLRVPEPGGRTWDCPIITYFFVNGTLDISGDD